MWTYAFEGYDALEALIYELFEVVVHKRILATVDVVIPQDTTHLYFLF